jgi:hypothetical protein
MVLDTPVPEIPIDVPIWMIVVCIIGFVLLCALGCFLSYCCKIYFFVISRINGRPPFLYSLESVNRDCGTLACINASQGAIICCCPSHREDVEKANIFPSQSNTVNLTNTKSIFKFRERVSNTHHLQSDNDASTFMPDFYARNAMLR